MAPMAYFRGGINPRVVKYLKLLLEKIIFKWKNANTCLFKSGNNFVRSPGSCELFNDVILP